MSDQLKVPIDLTMLGRGTTPHNITQDCLNLCQQYLAGVWLNLTVDDLIVKRIPGGLTNQLYYCAINQNKQISDANVPQEVAILLYSDKYFSDEDITINWMEQRMTDTILAILVSESGLGPKVYSVFERGQILKYYKHKNFRSEEQKDFGLVKGVAQKIAQIHAMDVPIKKTGNWLIEYFDSAYRVAKNRFDLNKLIEETESQTLKTYDVGQEIQWLKKIILNLNSPHTFTHADVRGSNIMITENDGIVICDFELSSYGYRGFDFGTLFCEWGRTWGQWDDPHQFPNDETFKIFIESYIKESVKLKGKQFIEDKRNSFENILKEVKIFTLVGYMWVTVFLLQKNLSIFPDTPFSKLQLMEPTEKVYKNAYHKCKQTLLNQNIIQRFS